MTESERKAFDYIKNHGHQSAKMYKQFKKEFEKELQIDKAKLRPISESQRSCLECYYGSQLLGGSPAWCLHTGNKIHELVGCELWRKE